MEKVSYVCTSTRCIVNALACGSVASLRRVRVADETRRRVDTLRHRHVAMLTR